MPTNTYELIVLGDEFAGLVAGTLAAQAGLRVLVAVSGSTDSYQLGPYDLPREAVSLAAMNSLPIRRVIEHLHFQHPLRRKIEEHVPPLQLASPRCRVDITDDDGAFLAELNREADNAEAIARAAIEARELTATLDDFFATETPLPPTRFLERREVAKLDELLGARSARWWQDIADDALGAAMFSAPAALGTHAAPGSSTALARARAFNAWTTSGGRVVGDWRTLRDLFLDKLESHGGDVRICRASHLQLGWGGKATGVVLDDGEELGADQVIVAGPIADLEALCRRASKKLKASSNDIELAGYRYVLNLVVDELAIPEGMGRNVLWVGDPNAPLTGANALHLSLSTPDSQARVIVTIAANCEVGEGGSREQAFADLRVGIREAIEQLMPFVTDHIIVAHSPHERLPAEGLEDELELDEPLEPSSLWRSRVEPVAGITAIPFHVGLKNVLLCSSQVMPQLGLEGEFAVGWQTARQVLADTGKKLEHRAGAAIASGE